MCDFKRFCEVLQEHSRAKVYEEYILEWNDIGGRDLQGGFCICGQMSLLVYVITLDVNVYMQR